MLQLVCEILLAIVFVFGLYLLHRKLIGKIERFNENGKTDDFVSGFEERSDKDRKNN